MRIGFAELIPSTDDQPQANAHYSAKHRSNQQHKEYGKGTTDTNVLSELKQHQAVNTVITGNVNSPANQSSNISVIFSKATCRPGCSWKGTAMLLALITIPADSRPSTTLRKAVPSSDAPTYGAATRLPHTPIPRYSTRMAKSYVSIQTGRTTCGTPALFHISSASSKKGKEHTI